MVAKRQKSQMEMAFMAELRGEAPKPVVQGIEATTAKCESESPASEDRLMEEVCERGNLLLALKRVKENKGSPGIDGMTVEELTPYLKEHWFEVREELLNGSYKPKPVKRVEIPKPDGGIRKLGIPTVLDRFIQQAILKVLQRKWDSSFSDHSYGFRPGRSAHMAVKRAKEYISEGYEWVVDMDIEKFFDRVNHDILMSKVAKRVKDKRLLKLIRAFLNAGVMENGLASPTDKGTPQGGPLSPLLSNLMLDQLDKELEKRGHKFVRYADDCNIYVRSERAGLRVMESIKRFLGKKLKLKVNENKSAVARPSERKFLGFSFTANKLPKVRIAQESLLRFRKKIRTITRRSRAISLPEMIVELAKYLKGWRAYFGLCETPSVMEKLDGWIRRRLRCFIWKQMKRGKRRYKEFKARGISSRLAASTAWMSSRGCWASSQSEGMRIAYPNSYFKDQGLPALTDRQAKTYRTAVYGPVCTVV